MAKRPIKPTLIAAAKKAAEAPAPEALPVGWSRSTINIPRDLLRLLRMAAIARADREGQGRLRGEHQGLAHAGEARGYRGPLPRHHDHPRG